ncbi:MAG TPA: cytochrome C [Chitinophagaceae bacterium]|nr:cytochrome C [Chitinophagaceae bacterium]
MRKFAVLCALLFVGIAPFYFSSCSNSEKEAEPPLTQNQDSITRIERGDYLANHVAVCIDCHSTRDLTKWSLPVIPGTEGGGAGFPFTKTEMVPGMVFAPNITPFALKDWSDDDIAKAMTTGVNRKGDTLFPIMPYHNYSRVAKDDIYSIIAYLRTLKSIDSLRPPRKLDISMSMLGPVPQPDLSKNVRPDLSDKIKYGEYLTTLASCGDCHTPRTPQGAPIFDKAFSGGFVFATPFFKVAVANITPDTATGIGGLTEDAFVQKFQANSSPDKINIHPGRENSIMPWAMYGTMKEEDLRAIYAYLRTMAPVTNKVEKWPK